MTDFNEMLQQVKKEMAVESAPTVKKEKKKKKKKKKKGKLIDINVALSFMKKKAEANRDPRLKYVDKFKDQMLKEDYENLCRKIDMFDLRSDEVDDELRRLGINV